MTNAVDVLLVGGPKHAQVACINRAAMPNYIGMPENGIADVYSYIRHTWKHDDTGMLYHVGIGPGVQPTDSLVQNAIDLVQFPPSWDLNPPYAVNLVATL